MPDPDIFFATIAELGAKVRAGEISVVELTRAFAQRLERLGPRYNALALPLTEQAIRRAKDVDGDLKRQRDRGPLQGIPFGVKDLLSYAGQPTTWGARPYAGQVFDYNAAVIEKLDRVGAILTGKLAMIELAGGGGYRSAGASLTGPALNPWDRKRWAGGSSGGSAAAVAAGLVPFSIGSETNGSIVGPAAFCGVTGLRPTYGLVSRHGAMPLAWTLDRLGPFCRSAEDCGLVLQAMAGGDARDPGSAGKSFYYTPQYAREMKELRIGYAPVDFTGTAEPAVRPVFEAALAAIREIGVRMMETRLPDFPFGPAIGTIISAEGSANFEPLIESGRVNELADPKQIAGLKAGLEITAKDYLKAQRIRRLVQQATRKIFADLDVLLAPLPWPPPPIDQPLGRRPSVPAAAKDAGMSGLTAAGNLAGLPALVLPCGFADGLPAALQAVGQPFSENTLLALGRAYQGRTDWHRRRPPRA